MAIVGIDLGTTYSAVSRIVNGVAEIIEIDSGPTLPSVVSVAKSGKILVGKAAKRNQATSPQDTIIEIKRKMGEGVKVKLGNEDKSPQEISAIILATIKKNAEDLLGEEITGAVITCPAYFKDPQKQATKDAAILAGLNVLRIVNEPTAAAFAYGLDPKQHDPNAPVARLFLVYDLGGGTFDVTVIRMFGGNLEVLGTGGNPKLGGGNFDDCIVDWMIEQLRATHPEFIAEKLGEGSKEAFKLKLKYYAEEAKIALCGPPAKEAHQFQLASIGAHCGKPVSFSATLTMEAFEKMIEHRYIVNSLAWIDTAMHVPCETHGYSMDDLTDVLLVGGSTRIPLVRRILEQKFPGRVRGMECDIFPDEIVAKGAAIIAASIDLECDVVTAAGGSVDVTGHTLSVACRDDQKRLVLQNLIPKDTPLPVSASHMFQSPGEFKTTAVIPVYQGEGQVISNDTTMIGEFSIEVDPIKAPTPLKITLTLNEDGLLVAQASNELNGHIVKCEIKYDGMGRMSPAELAQKQAGLQGAMEKGVTAKPNPLGEGTAPAALKTGTAQRLPMPQPARTVPVAVAVAPAPPPRTAVPPSARIPAPVSPPVSTPSPIPVAPPRSQPPPRPVAPVSPPPMVEPEEQVTEMDVQVPTEPEVYFDAATVEEPEQEVIPPPPPPPPPRKNSPPPPVSVAPLPPPPPAPPPPPMPSMPATAAPVQSDAPAGGVPVDVAAALSPIMRTLYRRANDSFEKLPEDRQDKVADLIGQIEAAVGSGKAAMVMSQFYQPLKKLLEGV